MSGNVGGSFTSGDCFVHKHPQTMEVNTSCRHFMREKEIIKDRYAADRIREEWQRDVH